MLQMMVLLFTACLATVMCDAAGIADTDSCAERQPAAHNQKVSGIALFQFKTSRQKATFNYRRATSSCVPRDQGCPVSCPEGQMTCHTPPGCPTCDGYNFCATSCPVICNPDNETLCHDPQTMTDSCHPRRQGCPVTCLQGENMCHEPPTCDTCTGHYYCSSQTCPPTCTVNQTLCHDPVAQTYSCAEKSQGCPVKCQEGENVCHTPASCDTCDAHNWCSPATCPVACKSDETLCWDSETQKDSCHPMSQGCPVTCPEGDNKCYSPPMCDTCPGQYWCSPSSCPVVCGYDEMSCWNSSSQQNTCHPKHEGCPITCPEGDNMCHHPPVCDTCQGYYSCSPTTCPVTCQANETMCHDPEKGDSCHLKNQGCPVTCPTGENTCHMPPPTGCHDCEATNFCSPTSCPVHCNENETHCHDTETMIDSCFPKSQGCPVTCPEGENMCHSPPNCPSCHGHNYCSPTSCPVTCQANETSCPDPVTGIDSCHPRDQGCPITCPEGENVCTNPPPPGCDSCTGYSWCSPTSCPVHCKENQTMCFDPVTGTNSCHPKSQGCPVTCQEGQKICHSPPPPDCASCMGYNYCSDGCCTDELECPAI